MLDVINTVDWRLSPSRWSDRLHDFDDVVAWVLQFGFVQEQTAARLRRLARADPITAQNEFSRVRELREALYSTAYRQPDATGTTLSATELITSEYVEAIASGHLESRPGATGASWDWEFDVDLALPRRHLASEAVAFLIGVSPDALGQCADDECGWVFIDTSPRRNRRWCVAADCGNRNRVRRYNERARMKSGAASSPMP
jgi:predicted RNA-binding Zn ribbon-like protein